MPYVAVSGEPLFFATHASPQANALPVVLLHGAGANHLTWSAALRRWPNASAYLLDLPGHGRSGGRARSSVDEYAGVVDAWRQTVRLGGAIWIGHSLGGAIALSLALRQPDAVRKLVLIGAGAHFSLPESIRNALASDPPQAIDAICALAFAPLDPAGTPVLATATSQMMSALPAETLRDDFLAALAFDVRDRLGDVRAPTLIIAAEGDRLTPLADARLLARRIPGARLVVRRGEGHMSVALAPDALRELILPFLDI